MNEDPLLQIAKYKVKIEHFKNLAALMYSSFLNDIEQGLSLGSTPEGHVCQPQCEDCQWYNWAVSMKKLVDSGEFNEINS